MALLVLGLQAACPRAAVYKLGPSLLGLLRQRLLPSGLAVAARVPGLLLRLC